MSQIFIDKWANGVHTQQIKKIANSRYFVNNYNPATHFIEVYKHRLKGITQALCVEIEYMPFLLEFTEDCKHKTIAIFKIRAK